MFRVEYEGNRFVYLSGRECWVDSINRRVNTAVEHNILNNIAIEHGAPRAEFVFLEEDTHFYESSLVEDIDTENKISDGGLSSNVNSFSNRKSGISLKNFFN